MIKILLNDKIYTIFLGKVRSSETLHVIVSKMLKNFRNLLFVIFIFFMLNSIPYSFISNSVTLNFSCVEQYMIF